MLALVPQKVAEFYSNPASVCDTLKKTTSIKKTDSKRHLLAFWCVVQSPNVAQCMDARRTNRPKII